MAENSAYYLNPKWSQKGFLQLHIEPLQDRFFLHQYHNFSFKAKPFTEAECADLALSKEVIDWMHQFNGNLAFVDDFLAKPAHLTLHAMEKQRRDLYEKNNIAAIIRANPLAIDSPTHKIPLITHKIWVTSDKKPSACPITISSILKIAS